LESCHGDGNLSGSKIRIKKEDWGFDYFADRFFRVHGFHSTGCCFVELAAAWWGPPIIILEKLLGVG
jgi:hypothetical protein